MACGQPLWTAVWRFLQVYQSCPVTWGLHSEVRIWENAVPPCTWRVQMFLRLVHVAMCIRIALISKAA